MGVDVYEKVRILEPSLRVSYGNEPLKTGVNIGSFVARAHKNTEELEKIDNLVDLATKAGLSTFKEESSGGSGTKQIFSGRTLTDFCDWDTVYYTKEDVKYVVIEAYVCTKIMELI